jgi:hypothetical protein
MPSGPPLPGIKVPAFTELKVECDGSPETGFLLQTDAAFAAAARVH